MHNRVSRRGFIKAGAAAALAAGAAQIARGVGRQAAAGMRDAKIIRVRDRQSGAAESYLEITSQSGLKGYAGPLLKEQTAAFPANLHGLLTGRDAADPAKLNFAALWAACHPGKALESYAQGKDPLTGAAVWGVKRKTRHSETGWVLTAFSAMDLALWDLRGKAAGQPVWRLLRAKRQRLNVYASMLGYSVKPTEAQGGPHVLRPRIQAAEMVLHERPGGRRRRPEAEHRIGPRLARSWGRRRC